MTSSSRVELKRLVDGDDDRIDDFSFRSRYARGVDCRKEDDEEGVIGDEGELVRGQ